MKLEFSGPAVRLQPDDISAAANALGCDPAAVHAVCDVEAAGSGFLPDSRPKILFEAHSFWKLTNGRFGESNVSASSWDRSLYGAGGTHQYDRLHQAIALNRSAALKSASWGMFQVMGSNAEACGFGDVELMVAAMVTGERAHLGAFVAFVKGEGDEPFLQETPPAFAAFAARYNGPGYAANAYDTKLEGAWNKWVAIGNGSRPASDNPAPRTSPSLHYSTLQLNSSGDAVAQLQRDLGAAGFDVAADGSFGPATRAAVVAFQKARGLVSDGIAGPNTMASLKAA